MSRALQLAGVAAFAVLALAILVLIAFVFARTLDHISPDGKVPLADAGLFTALLLSFREVVEGLKQIWRAADRSDLTSALSNSTPTATPNPPAGDSV